MRRAKLFLYWPLFLSTMGALIAFMPGWFKLMPIVAVLTVSFAEEIAP